jgi:hypothetical protein
MKEDSGYGNLPTAAAIAIEMTFALNVG